MKSAPKYVYEQITSLTHPCDLHIILSPQKKLTLRPIESMAIESMVIFKRAPFSSSANPQGKGVGACHKLTIGGPYRKD